MASPRSRLRRLALDGITTVLVLALLLAITEGLFRIFSPGLSLPQRPSTETPGVEPGLPRLHLEEDFAQPGVRGLTAGALYTANRDGFRGGERPRMKPENVARIAILGDSTAMGWGVENDETYAAQLEEEFEARREDGARSGPVEVLNFALAGLNSTGVLQRLEDLAIDFHPDIVVYGYSINDIEGPAYRRSLDREYAASLFRHDSPSQFWRWLRPRWLAFRELVLTPRGSFAFELDENYFENPEAWAVVRENFDRLARLGQEFDFCGVVLVHAQMQALNTLHPYKRHYAAIAGAARESGLVAVESLERFRAEDASSLWVNPNDRHANARGHAVFAEILADALDDLPARCWGASGNPDSALSNADSVRGAK